MAHPHPVMLVAGTRPEVIKLAPLYMRLRDLLGSSVAFILTGQHGSAHQTALRDFGMNPTHVFPKIENSSLPTMIHQVQTRVAQACRWLHPQLVVGQGDTTTAMATALAAQERAIPLLHVEAGLRSHDLSQPWPEEGYRCLISRLAHFHCAPNETARQNLLAEGISPDHIAVTGNTGIDALYWQLSRIYTDPQSVVSAQTYNHILRKSRRYVLVTSHRREWHPRARAHWFEQLPKLSQKTGLHFLVVAHPNPAWQHQAKEQLNGRRGVDLLPPLGHADMVAVMMRAFCVVTDSGGMQEELPTLGKPMLVCREKTERSDGLVEPAFQMVGYCPERLHGALIRLLNDDHLYLRLAQKTPAFGDGMASDRIASIVADQLRRLQGHVRAPAVRSSALG